MTEQPQPSEPADDVDGLLLATVTVQKVMTDDDVVIYYNATDEDGYELPVIDAVGMLEFAKHELLTPPELIELLFGDDAD